MKMRDSSDGRSGSSSSSSSRRRTGTVGDGMEVSKVIDDSEMSSNDAMKIMGKLTKTDEMTKEMLSADKRRSFDYDDDDNVVSINGDDHDVSHDVGYKSDNSCRIVEMKRILSIIFDDNSYCRNIDDNNDDSGDDHIQNFSKSGKNNFSDLSSNHIRVNNTTNIIKTKNNNNNNNIIIHDYKHSDYWVTLINHSDAVRGLFLQYLDERRSGDVLLSDTSYTVMCVAMKVGR
jgi:hypothetical protein